MTKPSYEELRKLADKASPGEWEFVEGGVIDPEYDDYGVVNTTCQYSGSLTIPNKDNAKFIAAANPRTILELLSELARARGLLQRLFGLVESGALVRNLAHDGDMMAFMRQSTLLVSTLAQVQNELTPPNFQQSSSLVSQGAESADIGKLESADNKTLHDAGFQFAAHGLRDITNRQAPVQFVDESGVEMGKVNRVEENTEGKHE